MYGFSPPYKRIFDIVFSVLIIIILIPFLFVIGLINLFQSGWPVLYSEERIGLSGTPFKIHKFRSMVKDSDNLQAYFTDEQLQQYLRERKLEDDPRVTGFGRILRKTSLDELPQFFDVLIGTMSVVGPRPIVADEFEYYSREQIDKLLSVKPGITGYWQVSGRNDLSYENGKRQEAELYYVEHAGLLLDLSILLKTPLKMIVR